MHHGGVGVDIFEGFVQDGQLKTYDLRPIPWVGLRRDTLEGIPMNVPINAHQFLAAMYKDDWSELEWDRTFRAGRPRATYYVDGVFDLFHHGHMRLLRSVAKLGRLVVGVHSDECTEGYKRRPYHDEKHRYDLVRNLKFVDRVIEDAPINPTCDWLDAHGLDKIVHGDNLSEETARQWYGHAEKAGRFMLVPSTPGISTTGIIGLIGAVDCAV